LEVFDSLPTSKQLTAQHQIYYNELRPHNSLDYRPPKRIREAVSEQLDSRVASHLFGILHSWMSDQTSNVHLIAARNGISKMPPQRTKAERFDRLSLLDFPNPEQKEAISQQHLSTFELNAEQTLPNDKNSTRGRCGYTLSRGLVVSLIGWLAPVVHHSSLYF
jgi:hypothetical protein